MIYAQSNHRCAPESMKGGGGGGALRHYFKKLGILQIEMHANITWAFGFADYLGL